MPIGGIISGIGSIVGGISSAGAARDAARIQADAANRATDLAGKEFQQVSDNLRPFLQLGTTSANVLGNDYFGISPSGTFNPNAPFLQPVSGTVGAPPNPADPNLRSQFTASPGYQYQLDQITNALQNSAAVKTGAVSGNMMRDLSTNAQGLASQDWWQFYNQMLGNYDTRYQDEANRRAQIISTLGGMAGAGQNAAAQQGGFGQNAVAQAISSMNQGANARAAGVVGANNNMIGGITSAFNNPSVTNSFSNFFGQLFGGGNDFGGGASPVVPGFTGGGPE